MGQNLWPVAQSNSTTMGHNPWPVAGSKSTNMGQTFWPVARLNFTTMGQSLWPVAQEISVTTMKSLSAQSPVKLHYCAAEPLRWFSIKDKQGGLQNNTNKYTTGNQNKSKTSDVEQKPSIHNVPAPDISHTLHFIWLKPNQNWLHLVRFSQVLPSRARPPWDSWLKLCEHVKGLCLPSTPVKAKILKVQILVIFQFVTGCPLWKERQDAGLYALLPRLSRHVPAQTPGALSEY